jgi:serine protease Do
MASVKTKITSLGLLCIGLIIGVLLVSNLDWIKRSIAVNDKSGAPEADLKQGREQLDDISKVFAAVSKKVNPTVVSIKTERTVKNTPRQQPQYQNNPRPFSGTPFDDFFDRFFDQPFPENDNPMAALGSGVIISSEGYIITNYHVVANFDNITVTLDDERSFKAKIIGTDPKTDIAVIKIDAKGLPAAEPGNSDNVEVGEWVIAIGNPLGYSHTVTAGIISAKGRNLNPSNYENFLQTDAAINPGNSGGALVDLKGKLIGINTAIATQTGTYMGIGFAIPANLAKRVMDELIAKGKVTRGWLGVAIQDISDEMAEAMNLKDKTGTIVSNVVPDAPAAKAGIRPGDVIKHFNNIPVKNSDHLKFLVAEVAPGTKVKVDLVRGKKEMSLFAEIKEFPADEAAAPELAQAEEEKLGIKVELLTKDVARQYGLKSEKGVIVVSVTPGGPGSRAGLEPGDAIKEINQEPVSSLRDYEKKIRDAKKGDSLLLLIERNGNFVFVGVKIPKE